MVRRCLLAACPALVLILSLTGCPNDPVLTVSGSGGGVAGVTSSGVGYGFSAPFTEQDKRRTIVGMAQLPGKKSAPAFMLRLRLAEESHALKIQSKSDNERTTWTQQFRAAGDKTLEARYEVTYGPLSEELTLAGTVYPLERGRLFLLDLRTQPATITQLPADLGAVIQVEKPGYSELHDAVKALETQYPELKELNR